MNSTSEHAVALASARLTRLLAFLESDPNNLSLLGDATACAFDAQQFERCDELLARQQALGAVPPESMHLRGLCAMARGKFEDALRAFAALPDGESHPAIRYNKAYAHAMLGAFDETLALLDEGVLTTIPQAITLQMRSLHHQGRLDEVIEVGKRYADHPETGIEVCGLLAAALFDAGHPDSAQQFASLAKRSPDGLAIGGLLALGEGREFDAMALFAEALRIQPAHSRALLGTGLVLLEQHRFEQAAQHIDAPSESFRTHAGSWIAAGWAHLLNGDLQLARSRFEQGAHIDRGFAEAPGALAIVALREGRLDEARAHTKVALRLDPECLSAALAKSLLSTSAGDQTTASQVLDAALNRPLDPQGNTLAKAIARRVTRSNKTPPLNKSSQELE
ncbi:tetratricopeptide (TPR) repeat protein [Paraburkholderia sp. Clong3]|uniref:tetratricopeptide repeat protein n=1 Tax=Paraburkholderia sp. Clong3 TaxID=2991061 RepID=UPI003D256909